MTAQDHQADPCRGNRNEGITLVEIFVALAVLAIGLTVVASPLQRMSARIDVDIARENIIYALDTAQRSAVRASVPVRVYLEAEHSGAPPSALRLVAGYSTQRGGIDSLLLPKYTLPEHISAVLSSELSMIVFLPDGRASERGVIRLTSAIDPDHVVEIDVEAAVTPRAPGSPPDHRASR